MKELICIVCPKGCHLQVDEEHDYAVTGNSCPRGAEYGRAELTHPTRVVTSTVRCTGGAHPRCPVKTDRAVPKELIFQVMEEINGLSVSAPVHVGQVLLEHVCGTQADLIITRDVTVV
jgi:CxxC motif-containing protein